MNWQPDILGEKFEQLTIKLKDDYEGEAIATLIRRLAPSLSDTSILYIHGFNDYFFQREMAFHFSESGYNFYALDLRKYGRSYLPHQKFNDIRDLKSYYEELNLSIKTIHSEGSRRLILMGHSTGGLVATLYAKDNAGKGMFDGVILNSPFFEFNVPPILKSIIPPACAIGRIFPDIKIGGILAEAYGESLHKDYKGEWNYNLKWKPNTVPPISLGWLRAIREGHKELKTCFPILQPVLILHSTATATDWHNDEQMHTMDAVLSVKDIARIGKNIKGDVQITAVKDGMHDLILSRKDVRESAYKTMLSWIKREI